MQLFDSAVRPEPSLLGGLIDMELMITGPLHNVTLTQSEIIALVVTQAKKEEVLGGGHVAINWSRNTALVQTL